MKEQTRVTLGIILWAVVLLGLIVAGVSYIINTEKSAVEEIAESVAESAPEVPVVNIERVEPEAVGLDSRHLAYIADKVEEYIAKVEALDPATDYQRSVKGKMFTQRKYYQYISLWRLI